MKTRRLQARRAFAGAARGEVSTVAFVDDQHARICKWLREFLQAHGYEHDLQHLETWRAPLPPIQCIGVCRQGATTHLLVNHRRIGGKRLLRLLQYGVGGPAAVVPKLRRASDFTWVQHAWGATHATWAMGRHLLMEPPRRTLPDRCLLFRESFPRRRRVDLMTHVLCKLSAAMERPTLTCWTPVVFDDASTVQNDVGIVLFEYSSGMTTIELEVRLRTAQAMCIGSRYLGRLSNGYLSICAKRRVDVVLTMATITGDSCTSLNELTSMCTTFHPLMYTATNYPCYAYIATLGETTHVTYSIFDEEFISKAGRLPHCCCVEP